MKQILLLLLLLPAAAFSQRIQSDQTDEFGQSRRIATSRVEFNGFTNSLAAVLTINECDTLLCMNLFFRTGRPTSINERTKALLKLENGETIQAYNQDGNKKLTATETGFIVFTLDESSKTKLLTYKVVSYTIQTDNAHLQIALDEVQQTAFYKTIHILESQARSLAVLD